MNYKLYLNNQLIGSIVNVATDFSSESGIIKFDSEFEMSEHFKSYINFCIRCSQLLINGSQNDYESYIDLEENKFIDYIDSTDWYLIDTYDIKRTILVPFFCSETEITWVFT